MVDSGSVMGVSALGKEERGKGPSPCGYIVAPRRASKGTCLPPRRLSTNLTDEGGDGAELDCISRRSVKSFGRAVKAKGTPGTVNSLGG